MVDDIPIEAQAAQILWEILRQMKTDEQREELVDFLKKLHKAAEEFTLEEAICSLLEGDRNEK